MSPGIFLRKYEQYLNFGIDQSRILHNALRDGNIVAKITERGICIAMCVDWVARIVSNAPVNPTVYHSGKIINNLMNSQMGTLFTTWQLGASNIASHVYGMHMVILSREHTSRLGRMASGLIVSGAVFKHSSAYINGCGILGIFKNDVGHAIGFRCRDNNICQIFDPNLGMLTLPNKDILKTVLFDMYESFYSEYDTEYVLLTFIGMPTNLLELRIIT